MKHLQLMMVALFMLMGVSLTSCLNSESDPYNYRSAMVKVQSVGLYTYFRTTDDVVITPTAESIAALEQEGKLEISKLNNKIANIGYRWDPAVVDVPSDAKNISDVDLYFIESLDAPAEIVNVKGESKDSIADAAVIELTCNPSGYEYKPYFFDETTLILPVNYFMEKTVHTLRLLYYKGEAMNAGSLRLYLRHNANNDLIYNNATSYEVSAYYGYLSFFYKAYDLSAIFYQYQMDSGAFEYPTQIDIVYEANPYSWDLDDAQTETKTYTVEYKPQTAE